MSLILNIETRLIYILTSTVDTNPRHLPFQPAELRTHSIPNNPVHAAQSSSHHNTICVRPPWTPSEVTIRQKSKTSYTFHTNTNTNTALPSTENNSHVRTTRTHTLSPQSTQIPSIHKSLSTIALHPSPPAYIPHHLGRQHPHNTGHILLHCAMHTRRHTIAVSGQSKQYIVNACRRR